MAKAIEVLRRRGFIDQTTHESELEEYFTKKKVTCYIGFDPTAASLHVGSLIPIMALAHMQRGGHRPIALIGGGTGLIGDPSGKQEMRKMLTLEKIEENARGIETQLSNFLDFESEKALLINNAKWLTCLNHLEFLRDIGRCFSVNRMIKTESYKVRIDSEEGLNFIEFNYMVLQAYDFLKVFDKYGCMLQMGGSDQWGNIVAGIDLIRRLRKKIAFGITFPLVTTASGAKMGKTAKGAVWLDSKRTSPYEYYQYWINTDDRDVYRFLALFTFLPLSEIKKVESVEGEDLNPIKAALAFEATKLVHGQEEAVKSFNSSASIFGKRYLPDDILLSSTVPRKISGEDDNSIPCSMFDIEAIASGIPAFKLFHKVGLSKSRGASRRLIEQGGAYVNGERILDFDLMITEKYLNNNEILLRSGKKRFHKIKMKR